MTTPQELISAYPWMDYTIAETLIRAHENGTLATALEDWEPNKHQPVTHSILKGSVVVIEEKIKSSD